MVGRKWQSKTTCRVGGRAEAEHQRTGFQNAESVSVSARLGPRKSEAPCEWTLSKADKQLRAAENLATIVGGVALKDIEET